MVNSYRSLTQSYIKALYRQISNLALYNQDCPKETQLTSNAYTLNLVKQDRLSARYQSQCLKQALECLSSVGIANQVLQIALLLISLII